MDSLRVVCEYAPQVPAREIDRRLRKVYNLLSRPAPPRAEDPPPWAEMTSLSYVREEALEGGDR